MQEYGDTVNITGAATTSVMKKPGKFPLLTINKADAHTISIYDSNAASPASTDLIGTIKASAVEGTYWYMRACKKGLTIVTPPSFAGDITAAYNEIY